MRRSKKSQGTGQYRITLNEEQLRLVMRALESWGRLRISQTWDLADDLSFLNYDYSAKDESEFNRRILRRDACKEMLDLAMRAASGGDYMHWQKTDEVNTVLDMWSVIRNFFWHQLPEDKRESWTTDADPVFLWGPEPGIKVEKAEDD